MAKRTSAKFYIPTTPSDRAAAQATKRPAHSAVNFKISSATENCVGKKCAEDKDEEKVYGLVVGY
jgi:hypothetical protein